MLVLTEKDVLRAVCFSEVMDAVEAAMVRCEKKDYQMPPRTHIDYRENTFLLMPCFLEDLFGTKLVTVFPDNKSKNAPVTNGVMLLNHGATGAPLALINGRTLTAVRTGGVGGVSIRHLTPDTVKRVGVVGAGVQGYYQALFACSARNITDLYVYDVFPETLSVFEEKFSQEFPHVHFHKTSGAGEILESAEVVITATQSLSPVLPDEEQLLTGKHFVGIGSFKPNMREFPESLFRRLERVFVDTEHGIHETGDLITPIENGWIKREQVQTLGHLIHMGESKKETKQETTLFKSVGMALFDLCVSRLIYEKALSQGLGCEVDL